MKIGIDIGGSHVGMAVVEESKIIKQKEFIYDFNFKKDLRKNLESLLKNMISETMKEYTIEKIGISVAGRLQQGILTRSPNMPEMEGFDFIKELSSTFGLPVTINKDSFCAAKAEKEYGCLKPYSTCVFLSIGTGIGAVSYRDNNLYRDGYGHMIIEKDGKQCGCGKHGCFEAYCSIRALKNEVIKLLNKEHMSGKGLHSFLAKNQGNPEVEAIVEKYVDYFSVGLSNVIDIVLPEAIGFGGSFSYYEDVLLERIRKNILEKNLLVDPSTMPTLVIGDFKNDAGIIGATLF